MNYKTTTDILRKAGYIISNTCRFEGKTYHDFSTRKGSPITVSLTVDSLSGSVESVSVTKRKWDTKTMRYEPIVETINDLQTLTKKFTPKTEITL
jgi:hypothetical protein